jgi:RNA 2',3'-cyclic 3'-phosphodiesterase
MRTFIAVDLDPAIKSVLLDFIRRLKKIGEPKVGWAKENGMHLTLKFLGEIDEDQAVRVKECVTSVAGKVAAFPLKIRGTGFFPQNARHPRVLWVGTSAEPVLRELQRELELRLAALGFPREERAFHPHLTLGRVKSPGGLPDVISELERNASTEFGEMTVRKITLFRSTLKPTGAEYSILEEGRLK